jgi:beta-galactosidase
MNTSPLNFGWRWYRDPAAESFELVDLPHSTTDLPVNNFSEREFQFVSRYEIHLPADTLKPGLRTWLRFEGVMARAEVTVNSVCVGEHLGGYTEFTFDITDQLVAGDNVVRVLVDGREDPRIPPFGHVVDYLTFAGIYREVHLEWRETFHLADVFVQPREVLTAPRLSVALTFANPDGRERTLGAVVHLGRDANPGREFPVTLQVPRGLSPVVTFELDPGTIALWSPEDPTQYTLQVLGKTVKFGFREARFTPEGFLLNGKPLKLRGLNRHQSWPHVGYAMPASAQAHDADVLKRELGVNLVRTSHYPQSRHFLDRCDEIGLLVFEEIPGWQHIGDLAWQEQSLNDLRDMVVRDRNRPSVILWGVRINESPDNDDFYRRTNALARELDPTRQTGGVRNFEKSALFEDVYTYNDFFHQGNNAALLEPSKVLPRKAPFLVTEHNGHMFPTKSFDTESRRLEHTLRHLRVLEAAYAHPQRSGAIGWCAFDYNTHQDFGSGDHICYHGVSDLFRLPKMAAAAYASQQSEHPFLEVGSALIPGDNDAATLGSLYVFTNAESVRVSRNGESLGEFFPDRQHWPHLPHPPVLVDDFVGDALVKHEGLSVSRSKLVKRLFQAIVTHGDKSLPLGARLLAVRLVASGLSVGKLTQWFTRYVGQWGQSQLQYTFEALIGGQVVATVRKGPSQSASLQVLADQTELVEASTWDTTRVTLRHLDTNSQVLTYSSETVSLTLDGPGELIGPAQVGLIGGVRAVWVRTRARDLAPGERRPLTLTVEGAQTGTQSLALRVSKEPS